MNNLAIIFIYTKKDDTTAINLQSLKDNNPNIPIFSICQKDFEQCHYQFLDIKPIKYWSAHEIWYWGSDNLFIHWYLTTKFRAKNYLIIEGDTFSKNISVYDFFGNSILDTNSGITGINYRSYDSEPNYYWFKEQYGNQFIHNIYTTQHLKSCTPLCGTLISNNCIESIIQHISENYFANKIFVETKFATIASYLGFNVGSYEKDLSSYINYSFDLIKNNILDLMKNDNLSGIFHPIKNLDIFNKEISKQSVESLLNNKNIKKALYGKIIDIKEPINKLHSIIPNEKIKINNFLGGDPAHGIRKELYLTYEKNNQIYETTIPEDEFLDFEKL